MEKVPTGDACWRAQWLRSEFARSPAPPVLQQRHEPIARGPGGVASSLPCGTVSNVIEAPKAPRGVGCDVGLRSDFPAGLRPSKPFVGIAAAVRGDAERENVTSCVTSCGATSRRLQRR